MIQVHPDQLSQLVDECNLPFTGKMVIPESFKVLSVVPSSSNDTEIQMAVLRYEIERVDGVILTRREVISRRSLLSELARRLDTDEGYVLLPSVSTSLTSILVAIEQLISVKLMDDDVALIGTNGNVVRIEARPKSLGWYGECNIKVTGV